MCLILQLTLSQQSLPAIIQLRHESLYIIQHLRPNRAIWHPHVFTCGSYYPHFTATLVLWKAIIVWFTLNPCDLNADSNNCTRLKLLMVHFKYWRSCHGYDVLAEGLAYLYANLLWCANANVHMLMVNVKLVDTAHEQARARQTCLRCVCGFFSPCDWLWALYFFGDIKGNMTLHKHHIILSPYLWAEEILHTNHARHSACEQIMSISELNWHFKMEKAGVWLRIEETECVCFCFYESRSTFSSSISPCF